MALGASVYKMICDPSGFREGVVATRRDLQLQKAVIKETIEPVKAYGQAIDALGDLLRKGGIDVDQFNAANRDLRASLPGNVEAQAALNREIERGESARRQLLTDEQRLAVAERDHAAAIEAAAELRREGVHTVEQHAAALKRLEAVHPSLIAQERRRIQLQSEAASLTERLQSPTERYRTGLARLNEMHGTVGLSAHTLARRKRELFAEYVAGVPVLGRFANSLTMINPLLIAGAAAGASMGFMMHQLSRAAHEASQAVREQWKEVDDLAKRARQLGLSVNALQTIETAGRLGGNVDPEQMRASLVRLSRAIGDAGREASPAAKALRQLGIDPRELRLVDTAEAFRKVADGMKAAEDPATRIRVATTLFGKEGSKLIPILAEGGASLDQFRKHLENTGLAISDFDAAEIERMNDSITAMRDAFRGAARVVASELAPHIARLVGGLNEAEVASGKFKNNLDQFRPAIGLMGYLIEPVGRLGLAFVNTTVPLEKLSMAAKVYGYIVGDNTEEMRKQAEETQKAKAQYESLAETMQRFEDIKQASQDRLDALQMGEREAKFAHMRRDEGFDEGMIDQLRAQERLIDRENELAKRRQAQVDTETRRVAAIRELVSGLDAEASAAGKTARQQLELSLTRLKADESTRRHSLALFDNAKFLAKNAENALANRQAIENLTEERRKIALNAKAYEEYTGSIYLATEAIETLQRRKQLERDMDLRGASDFQKGVALKEFDETEKIKARMKANEAFRNEELELRRQIRQLGMTDDEKKLDELRLKGANDEEVKRVRILQEQLHLRNSLLGSESFSLGMTKKGTMAAAEALERARKQHEVEQARRRLVGDVFRKPIETAGGPVPITKPTIGDEWKPPRLSPKWSGDDGAGFEADLNKANKELVTIMDKVEHNTRAPVQITVEEITIS